MQVFLSHSRADRKIALELGQELRAEGLTVWDAEEQIVPGENWAEKVGAGLRESQAMVVLVSPEALASEWVRREIEFALAEPGYSRRLIPVVVGPLGESAEHEVPWILRRLSWIELADGHLEETARRVAEALRSAA